MKFLGNTKCPTGIQLKQRYIFDGYLDNGTQRHFQLEKQSRMKKINVGLCWDNERPTFLQNNVEHGKKTVSYTRKWERFSINIIDAMIQLMQGTYSQHTTNHWKIIICDFLWKWTSFRTFCLSDEHLSLLVHNNYNEIRVCYFGLILSDREILLWNKNILLNEYRVDEEHFNWMSTQLMKILHWDWLGLR